MIKDDIEKILQNFLKPSEMECFGYMLSDQLVELVERETAHPTKKGFCCACNYDIARMEETIKDIKAKARVSRLQYGQTLYDKGYDDGRLSRGGELGELKELVLKYKCGKHKKLISKIDELL